ncbi:NAD-P-binding protein [Stereum hirsutum FP-91666 SS1]|uniref:NAD-P-binding protein n=1 Tax=Stereum hirsutum (strain FP-91666) TaxID=721885 RepID=UPI00044498DF|nr:NAD-P-binding protein [Stereum hirsutum FP-91666 SS1]EIM83816.1 NAD-P-binding protein [Stereum hirsutum FP-91666 SS1]
MAVPSGSETQKPHEVKGRLVWLITGASSGLGLALVQRCLVRGDYVIATARTKSKMDALLPDLFDEVREDAASYQSKMRMKTLDEYLCEPPEKRLHVLEMDVTESAKVIREKVKDVVDGSWGRVDVLVNNAGMAIAGVTEESGSEAMQIVFATNLFGAVNVTNAVLPYMRERRSGTIVMTGSRSAWRNEFAGVGLYAASKAALHSYTETLSAEVRSFNIRTLILAPGSFVTPGIYPPLPPLPPPSSSTSTSTSDPSDPAPAATSDSEDHTPPEEYANRIPAYDDVRTQMIHRMLKMKNDPPARGDPKLGMEVVVDLVRGEGRAGEILRGRGGADDHVEGPEAEEWPMWLFLGEDGQRDVRARNERVGRCLDVWGEVGRGLEMKG